MSTALCIEETFAIDGGLGVLSTCALACEVGADVVLAHLSYETDEEGDEAIEDACAAQYLVWREWAGDLIQEAWAACNADAEEPEVA